MTASAAAPAPLFLHVPDEPTEHLAQWRKAIDDGTPLADVVGGEGGVADWLWRRWRVLARTGFDGAALRTVAVGYRRELGLWLVGDRTWSQACSGLIGRIQRRVTL